LQNFNVIYKVNDERKYKQMNKIMTANRLTTTPPPPFSRPRFISITALILTLALASCGESGNSGDSNTGGNSGAPQTVSYSGTASGETYTLIITESAARYAAKTGDTYVLIVGSDISSGTVSSVAGSVLTLKPSNNSAPTFTATVSSAGITAMNGTITFKGDSTKSAPATISGSGSGSAVSDSSIIGTWAGESYAGIFTFTANGTWTQERDGITVFGKGTYATSGSKLIITTTHMWESKENEGKGGLIEYPPDYWQTNIVDYSISGNILTFDGKTYTKK
jgi:hypothetical protein